MDDSIYYSKKSATIDKMILSLKDEFLLNLEEDMASFLGINIERDKENNTLTMTQTGLIDRILTAMDLETCNPTYTPAEKDPLYKDEEVAPCCEAEIIDP